jgi:ferric-dicitrate binding protein FerR (iron transport regulator)
MNSFKHFTVVLLCVLLVYLPVMAEPQAAAQQAGQISALIPAATRNSQAATVKEELDWNDLVKTEHTGRVRAGLTDGSILSVGSDSELRVVQHDATSQQTSLELNFGKVRSQVVKITKPAGKFEVKTPNAVIGVIGTDFYAAFDQDKTTVICYKGTVTVTPGANAKVTHNSGQSNAATNSITVAAGQMVEITNDFPPPGFKSSQTPPDTQQASLLATGVSDTLPVAHASHLGRNIGITTAVVVAAGLAIGLPLGLRGGSNSGACVKNPATGACP